MQDGSSDITIHVTRTKVNTMVNAIRRFVKEEEGAAAAEYAMLLALITLGIITAMTLLATNIGIAITDAANKIVAPS